MQYLAYLAARLALGLASRLPAPLGYWLARRAGDLAWLLLKRQRRTALANLEAVFPERSRPERRRLARESFRHFACCCLELVKSPGLEPADPAGWFTPEQRALLDRAWAKGRGAVCVTGHLGNWEVTGLAMVSWGHGFNAIARPFKNRHLTRYLFGRREAAGIRVFHDAGLLRDCLRVLKEKGVLGFVMDQNAGRHGALVDFLGRPASTLRLPAELALRFGCPVLAGCAWREPGRRFRFHLEGEIPLPDSGDRERDVVELSRRMNEAIGRMVRSRPEQYLWAHRRWRLKPEWFPGAAGAAAGKEPEAKA